MTPSCSIEGVHPAVLGIVGNIEVSEAVLILTEDRPSLSGRIPHIAMRISFCTANFWASSSLDNHIFVQIIVSCIPNSICIPSTYFFHTNL